MYFGINSPIRMIKIKEKNVPDTTALMSPFFTAKKPVINMAIAALTMLFKSNIVFNISLGFLRKTLLAYFDEARKILSISRDTKAVSKPEEIKEKNKRIEIRIKKLISIKKFYHKFLIYSLDKPL